MPVEINLSALESHLWEAANSLRGPADATNIKTYIFPLLFYKRLPDAYDEEHQGLAAQYGMHIEEGRQGIPQSQVARAGAQSDDVGHRAHELVPARHEGRVPVTHDADCLVLVRLSTERDSRGYPAGGPVYATLSQLSPATTSALRGTRRGSASSISRRTSSRTSGTSSRGTSSTSSSCTCNVSRAR